MNKSLFDIYTDYLICSFGLTTATGLGRLLGGEISHDQVTRLLSSPAKTSADLWRVVKPLVRQVESDDAVLIFDDSIEEKPYTEYQKRFSIEGYHKSLKQNAALEKSPTRTEVTQRNHFFASLCAYVKLESLKIRTGINHFALKRWQRD